MVKIGHFKDKSKFRITKKISKCPKYYVRDCSLSVIVLKYFIKQTSNESQFRNFIRSVGCQSAWPRNAVAFKNLLPATFKILITESDSTKPIFFRVDTQDVWSPVRHTFDPPHLMSNKFRHDVEIILIFILNSILNGINM